METYLQDAARGELLEVLDFAVNPLVLEDLVDAALGAQVSGGASQLGDVATERAHHAGQVAGAHHDEPDDDQEQGLAEGDPEHRGGG